MTLFDELVSALQPALRSVAPFILTRLLLRAGVLDRAVMTPAEFRNVLPVVEAGLRESLGADDFASVAARIREVLGRWETAGRS